jgi:acetyl esterase
MEIYSNLLFGGDNQAAHAAAPLSADDLSGMPPSISFSAQCDPLADDGPLFAKRLEDAGCKASCIIDMGLVHAHLRARHSVERARHSFERVINACKSLSRGDWPLQL